MITIYNYYKNNENNKYGLANVRVELQSGISFCTGVSGSIHTPDIMQFHRHNPQSHAVKGQ
jgi:hypothetical protein